MSALLLAPLFSASSLLGAGAGYFFAWRTGLLRRQWVRGYRDGYRSIRPLNHDTKPAKDTSEDAVLADVDLKTGVVVYHFPSGDVTVTAEENERLKQRAAEIARQTFPALASPVHE